MILHPAGQLSAEPLAETEGEDRDDWRSDDPLMPAARRFPRDAWPPVANEEPPSGARPFVLRGAAQMPSAITAKHRTTPHQTPHTDPTTSDGSGGQEDEEDSLSATVPDTWYEQDD
ncbi:MAG TPA: hypothetical protein VFO16_15225 [Pseudonocardiaceae bacterium]|nr:hypothetical protein [Pseudonocardiaceae bacterium]